MQNTNYDFLRPADREFPPIVHVETTNVCNIKCIHCPQADPYNLVPGYHPQHMAFDIWKRVVDEVAKYGNTLRITPDGEPMLLKDWTKQIDYVVKTGIKRFTFNTNGLFMEGDKMEVLFRDDGMQVAVEFSIDALWKTSYDKIRVASDYNKLMKNIFTFRNEIDKRKKRNVKILVSCVVQPELEEDEFALFEKFWTPIADKVIKRRYINTKGLTPHKPEVEQHRDFRWPCLVLFTRMVVTWDGKIRFCPDDWEKKTTIGDINKQTLREVWTGKVMNHIRERHLMYDFQHSHKVCHSCNEDWKVIEWGNDYTKALTDLFGE